MAVCRRASRARSSAHNHNLNLNPNPVPNGIRIKIKIMIMMGILLACSRLPAQTVSVQAKNVSLREIAEQLAAKTGYEFHLVASKELDEARRETSTTDAPLGRALSEISAAFKCDFYSVDSRKG